MRIPCEYWAALIVVVATLWTSTAVYANTLPKQQQPFFANKNVPTDRDLTEKGHIVRIGVLAKRGEAKTLQRWQPLSEYLQSKVGAYQFTITPLSFDDIASAVRDHEVDFVLTNSSFYINLERKYGISRITTMKNRVAEGPVLSDFGGVIFTRRDHSEIHALSDFSGQHMIAVDERSFGGWQMAWLEMLENGFDPFKELASLSYAGTHDDVVRAVLAGKADIGTVRTDTLERMQNEGKIKLDDIAVISAKHYIEFPLLVSTTLYPEWPFAKVRGTADSLAHEVAIALMQMSSLSESDRCCGIEGWTTPGDYSLVDDALRRLRVEPYATYGQFTLKDVLQRYWYWWIMGIVILISALLGIIYLKYIQKLTLGKNKALEEVILLRNKELQITGQLEQGNIRLSASENRLKNAEKLASLGHRQLDLMTNELLWSDEIYHILELDQSKVKASFDIFLDRVHPADRAVVKAAYARSLKTKQPYEVEHRLLMQDGRIKHVIEICGTQFNNQGKPLFSMGTLQDITELVKTEQKMRQSKESAEAANQAKTLFLANMSHELRTPLNAILGFSELLHNVKAIPETERGYIEIINRSGHHLLQLINDVLDMSKIETGRMALELEDFDLGELVRDVMDLLQVRAEQKNLYLVLDQSSSFPRFIRGDATKLKQILINLLSNSLKFTHSGGVTLRLDVDKNDSQNLVLYGEVEDSGSGIKAEDIERIFQPFEQLAESVTQKGTGLGLTITRQFVEMMQGKIIAESLLGKGSVFRFWALVEKAEQGQVIKVGVNQHQVIGLQPGQPDIRILIVEDQLENQLLLQKILEPIGFNVRLANNGSDAVDKFTQWQPNLLWMNWHMPVMGGEQATREIRKLPGGNKVKIVALTTTAFSENKETQIASGIDDYLIKPYSPDELFDCMARQLGVRYIYRKVEPRMQQQEEASAILDELALAELPEMFLMKLLEAAEAGDRVESLILIEALEPEQQVTVNNLKRMVNNYHFDTLVEHVKQALSK